MMYEFIPESVRCPTTFARRMSCKVFWDYENCRKASEWTFEALYKSIRDRLENLSLEIKGYSVYSDEDILKQEGRQTLSDLGWNVINPSKISGGQKKKETVDLRMAVDISMFALERCNEAESTCIVVITGDSDFGYLLGQLRAKSYQIILMYNTTIPDRLSVHGHKLMRMFDVVNTSDALAEDTREIPDASYSVAPSQPPHIDDNEDNISVASLESQSWSLRVEDLVGIVEELTLSKGKAKIADGVVGNVFAKKFPLLKGYYKDIKQFAIKSNRLAIEQDPGQTSICLKLVN